MPPAPRQNVTARGSASRAQPGGGDRQHDSPQPHSSSSQPTLSPTRPFGGGWQSPKPLTAPPVAPSTAPRRCPLAPRGSPSPLRSRRCRSSALLLTPRPLSGITLRIRDPCPPRVPVCRHAPLSPRRMAPLQDALAITGSCAPRFPSPLPSPGTRLDVGGVPELPPNNHTDGARWVRGVEIPPAPRGGRQRVPVGCGRLPPSDQPQRSAKVLGAVRVAPPCRFVMRFRG